MNGHYICKVGNDKFVESTLSSLSASFDLVTLAECERKRKNNILEQENNPKGIELRTMLREWTSPDSTKYMISGNWLRQWSYYIFVFCKSFELMYRRKEILLE